MTTEQRKQLKKDFAEYRKKQAKEQEKFNYRSQQLANIQPGEYQAKIKIVCDTGDTNWLNVTDDEINAIKKILTRKK